MISSLSRSMQLMNRLFFFWHFSFFCFHLIHLSLKQEFILIWCIFEAMQHSRLTYTSAQKESLTVIFWSTTMCHCDDSWSHLTRDTSRTNRVSIKVQLSFLNRCKPSRRVMQTRMFSYVVHESVAKIVKTSLWDKEMEEITKHLSMRQSGWWSKQTDQRFITLSVSLFFPFFSYLLPPTLNPDTGKSDCIAPLRITTTKI